MITIGANTAYIASSPPICTENANGIKTSAEPHTIAPRTSVSEYCVVSAPIIPKNRKYASIITTCAPMHIKRNIGTERVYISLAIGMERTNLFIVKSPLVAIEKRYIKVTTPKKMNTLGNI